MGGAAIDDHARLPPASSWASPPAAGSVSLRVHRRTRQEPRRTSAPSGWHRSGEEESGCRIAAAVEGTAAPSRRDSPAGSCASVRPSVRERHPQLAFDGLAWTERGGGGGGRISAATPVLAFQRGQGSAMRGSLATWSALLAAVFSILVNCEETGVLQNEVYKKEGRENWADAQLLLARETLEHEVVREGAVSSSGDNFSELPRVAFLSKPQDPVTPKKEGNGEKRRKGKGRKRDPCLRKYKDYCFHGDCKYIKAVKAPSCICHQGYHGERCHAFSLPVENPSHSYDHTTILAVTAVVLSSLCLLIIAALLMLRCHKQGVYDVESEEKVKLGSTGNH